jgi:F-type H+-transporting ATPase subunit gamma
MATNTKTINRRIKSIVNTRKITKAMELVAASKMRKAVGAVLATRPYAALAWRMVDVVPRKAEEPLHPLLAERPEIRRTLTILITSDRGLCGGLNAQMLRKAAEFTAARKIGSVEFIAIGKRGEAFVRRRGLPLRASFPELAKTVSATAVRPLSRMAIEAFRGGGFDEVAVLYTDFVSAILQKPRSKILLPLRRDADLGQAIRPQAASDMPQADGPSEDLAPYALRLTPEYLFEPDPRSVLDSLLPRILESQLYQAVLEAQASEHSARMLAMRNASDAAGEMLDDLRFTFNQARQAGITQEIAEISAGRAALAKQ